MVNSKLILAVAGAGKTYYLADQLNVQESNILITFTNRNVDNLKREIIKIHGEIPGDTLVMTYAKFVYDWLIKPINPFLTIGDRKGLEIKGLDVYTEPEEQHKHGRPNPFYLKQSDNRHYLNKNNQLYISRMVKLFNKQKKSDQNLAFKRLEKYCDNLFVDEAQDFRSEDYKLLQSLCKLNLLKMQCVGDYYQHSVSYSNQLLRQPFVNNKKQPIPYEEYIKKEEETSEVDRTSLLHSRRVPETICKLIRGKLEIDIYSRSKETGKLILVDTVEQLDKIFHNEDITKIVYQEAKTYSFYPTVNWTYSKGDTYKNACVVLTNTFENLLENDFSIDKLSQQQINRLYVALTRASKNLYIVKKSLFDKIHKRYKRV